MHTSALFVPPTGSLSSLTCIYNTLNVMSINVYNSSMDIQVESIRYTQNALEQNTVSRTRILLVIIVVVVVTGFRRGDIKYHHALITVARGDGIVGQLLVVVVVTVEQKFRKVHTVALLLLYRIRIWYGLSTQHPSRPVKKKVHIITYVYEDKPRFALTVLIQFPSVRRHESNLRR